MQSVFLRSGTILLVANAILLQTCYIEKLIMNLSVKVVQRQPKIR